MYHKINDYQIIDLTRVIGICLDPISKNIEISLDCNKTFTHYLVHGEDISMLHKEFNEMWVKFEKINRIKKEEHFVKLANAGFIFSDSPNI